MSERSTSELRPAPGGVQAELFPNAASPWTESGFRRVTGTPPHRGRSATSSAACRPCRYSASCAPRPSPRRAA